MNYQYVPFREFNGHYIRNDVSIPKDGKYILIENYESFTTYFGTASLGPTNNYVTPELFDNYCILAVLKDYAAIAKVRSVVCSGPTLVLTYSLEKFETQTWTGCTPVIVSVPKSFIGHSHCTDFQFLRQEATISIDDLKDANTSAENILPGGWSEYHSVNNVEKEIFKKGIGNIIGAKYIPVLCKHQVASKMNYTFICLSHGIYQDAKWSLAKVSLFSAPDGKVYRKAIKDLGPIENMRNIDQRIQEALETTE